MMRKISLVMITKNASFLLYESLSSVKGLADEIIIVDNYSSDDTISIAKQFDSKIFLHEERDLGKQKQYAIRKAKNDWILLLDSDEIVSHSLKEEINAIRIDKDKETAGYIIPYQNHLFGKPISYGGENYKMLRLFNRKYGKSHDSLIHEKIILQKGKTKILKNKIFHYSYRSLSQIYKKFTEYALRDAQQKSASGEKTSLKKIIMYPPHMFWARFVKDKGYKDGLFRIPLDMGFAYMELLTYFRMIFKL